MGDLNDLGIDVRKKNEELQDVFRDLERWEADIKITDEKLRNNSKQQGKLPPVRSSEVKKLKPKRVEKKHNASAKTITGTDYNSWDKFDVDKALEEIDSGEGDSNSDSDSDSDEMDLTLEEENLEIERKKQKAIVEKDRGNTFFSKGKYNEAIAAYTKGLRDDPTNAILPANRAMALLKTGQIAAAEQDCTLAISLDCTYTKAFHRRGTCRFALKKYQLARQDFLKVLEMDPSNKHARTELDKIEEEFRKKDKPIAELQKEITKLVDLKADQKENNVSILPCDKLVNDIELVKKSKLLQYDKPGLVLPIDKPSHLRSKKPLKKMIINETKEEVKPLSRPYILEIKNSKSSISESLDISCASSSGIFSQPSTPLLITPSEPDFPGVPQTAFQFEINWRKLRHWPNLQLNYLKQFPTEDINRLFKQSIETEVFTGIFRILKTFFVGNELITFQYLQTLTKVGRFGTTVMFLLDEDQKNIKFLIEALEKHSYCTKDELIELKKCYLI